MGRKSTIDQLPHDQRAEARRIILQSRHLSLAIVTASLKAKGFTVSRTAVHRYRAAMEKEAARSVAPGTLFVIVVDPQAPNHELVTIKAERSHLLSQLAALYP